MTSDLILPRPFIRIRMARIDVPTQEYESSLRLARLIRYGWIGKLFGMRAGTWLI